MVEKNIVNGNILLQIAINTTKRKNEKIDYTKDSEKSNTLFNSLNKISVVNGLGI